MNSSASPRPAVLFVCLGNICRSPLAEGALRRAAQQSGLELTIDSAGTGSWHIGEPPDGRAQAAALRHGVDIGQLRGRQIQPSDFGRFTHIFALDHDNLAAIQAQAPADHDAEIALLLDMVPGREGQSVADPYWGGDEHFEITWQDVSDAADALVRRFLGPA